MTGAAYLVAAAVVAGLVTFCLRALPFALLQPLRESVPAARLAVWMPAGVLTILALVMLLDAAALAPGEPVDGTRVAHALIAAAVTGVRAVGQPGLTGGGAGSPRRSAHARVAAARRRP